MSTPAIDRAAPDADDGSRLHDVLSRMGVSETAYRALIEQLPVIVYLEALEGLSHTVDRLGDRCAPRLLAAGVDREGRRVV